MRAIPSFSILAILLAACGGASKDAGETPAAAIVPEGQTSAARLDVYSEIGGDFTLTDHRGRPFRLADTHGKVRLLFFGYAMCPDVCPMTLSKVVQVRRLLGSDAEDVMTLFVSVDPERDTPEKLRGYLGYFDLGEAAALSGTTEEIDAIVDTLQSELREGRGRLGRGLPDPSHAVPLPPRPPRHGARALPAVREARRDRGGDPRAPGTELSHDQWVRE